MLIVIVIIIITIIIFIIIIGNCNLNNMVYGDKYALGSF